MSSPFQNETVTWSAGLGIVRKLAVVVQIRDKPYLGFPFDSVYAEEGHATKVVAGVTSNLTQIEIASVIAWLNMFDPAQHQKILGVNANGVYVGEVALGSAYHVVRSAPPNGDHWRYDFATERWVYIHGVDADGRYIGNVPVGSYVEEANDSPPPGEGDWRWIDGEWEDVRTLEQKLQSYAAHKRWSVEVNGIVVSGLPVLTDDRSKLMILGARAMAEANPGYVTPWATSPSTSVEIDAATIIGLSNAVHAHVAGCFAAWKLVIAEIAEGNITTPEEIDAAEWPPNS